jgi:hypothetical protein
VASQGLKEAESELVEPINLTSRFCMRPTCAAFLRYTPSFSLSSFLQPHQKPPLCDVVFFLAERDVRNPGKLHGKARHALVLKIVPVAPSLLDPSFENLRHKHVFIMLHSFTLTTTYITARCIRIAVYLPTQHARLAKTTSRTQTIMLISLFPAPLLSTLRRASVERGFQWQLRKTQGCAGRFGVA